MTRMIQQHQIKYAKSMGTLLLVEACSSLLVLRNALAPA